MYPRSFLCEEAKIKRRTPLKKELCEIGEEAIWESRFTSFFRKLLLPLKQIVKLRMFDCGIRVKNAIKINLITVITNYLHY